MGSTSVSSLLAAAASGDQAAWNQIVARYEGLVWSVARGYRLGEASTADVAQTVWLRLAEHCLRIRDPDRLAGWLATTTRNEALRVSKAQQRTRPVDDIAERVEVIDDDLDIALIGAEETRAVVEAFAALDAETQTFLRWLSTDPPLTYQEISELIGRTIGNVGPIRARCLDKLRAEMARQARRQRGTGA